MKLRARTLRPFVASLAIVAATLALGGCASVPNRHPGDPFEPFNRGVSQFNEGLDAALLKPVATAYKDHVPPLIRTGVSNFFGNLGDMWSFVNSALQGKVQEAADNFARVQVNTVWGVFGIFDVASDLNIDRHREDFGQTLGVWGVPAGPYVVLPIFGPSTLRDTVALPVDRKADLLAGISPSDVRYTAYTVRVVNARANLLRVSDVLDQAALDKYAFTRDAHLQRRRAEIYEPEDPRREVPPPLPPGANPSGTTPAGQPLPTPGQPPAAR